VLIRGFAYRAADARAADLVRPRDEDLFRQPDAERPTRLRGWGLDSCMRNKNVRLPPSLFPARAASAYVARRRYLLS